MTDDYMREEITFQADLLHRFTEKNITVDIDLTTYDEIWLTGSGDSHCVSLLGSSLGLLFGLPIRSLTPMNASYYMDHKKKKKLLLFAISVSGKTPRVLEVVNKVKKYYPDHKIVGLTDNPHSDLAKQSDHPIILQASPSEVLESSDYKDGIAKLYTGYHHDVAQTKTFFANILYLLAIIHPSFFTRNKNMFQSFVNWIEKAEHLVTSHPILYPQKTIFIGSGLQESLAQFGQYKWFEYTFPGQHQDVEEYAHTHYFTTDEKTTVIFFAPTGPLLDRALELITGALGNLIKPQMILITDKAVSMEYDCAVINISDYYENSQGESLLDRELQYYLFALVLLEWYTYHTARTNGFDTNQFRGGADGEKYVRGSYHTIRKSKINE